MKRETAPTSESAQFVLAWLWKDMNLDDANLIRLISLESFLHGLASFVVGTTIYLELYLRRAFIWIDDIWI